MPKHPVHPPEWIDGAPVLVSESIEIAVTPETVWLRIVDHETWPEWFSGLDSAERIDGGVGVGAGRRVKVGPLNVDEEFTAWDDNEHFAFAVTATKLPFLAAMAESVRLTSTETGTLVSYRVGQQARTGFGWLLNLASKRLAKDIRAALAELKRLLESQD